MGEAAESEEAAGDEALRVLFVGDVVGGPGRRALTAHLRELRDRHRIDLTIVNGENSAGGIGISERSAEQIFAAGADLITLGNHAYRQRDSLELLDRDERIVRPANFPRGNPGRGATVAEAAGRRIGVLNLSGALQLTVARSPFHAVEAELAALEREGAEVVIVDFHAEVTSEKVAMGWHLDGRVAAVLGTHTHVPTADARVLPAGTAFISDVGMTGPRHGVLGVRVEDALAGFVRQMPARFHTASEDVWINAVVVAIGSDGLARSIEQLLVPAGEV
jgi:2',3'-cyclic-nucleotide 2'-phosphodiesterase